MDASTYTHVTNTIIIWNVEHLHAAVVFMHSRFTVDAQENEFALGICGDLCFLHDDAGWFEYHISLTKSVRN